MEILVKYLDKDGYEWKSSNDFCTLKEARAHFKDVKNDRKYFARCAESDTAPATLETIQLVKDGEVIDDHFPEFG